MKMILGVSLIVFTLCGLSCLRQPMVEPDGLPTIQTQEQALRAARQALAFLDPPVTGVTHRLVRETSSAFIIEYPLLFAEGSASQHTEIVIYKFKPKIELLLRVPDHLSSGGQEGELRGSE